MKQSVTARKRYQETNKYTGESITCIGVCGKGQDDQRRSREI